MENFPFPVIKVKVIKVIKHSSLALFSYNIILKSNIILYIYSVPPETLNDLNDLDLNDRKGKIFHSYFFTLNNVIMCFFHFFICTFA